MPARRTPRRAGLIVLALLMCVSERASAQTLSVRTAGDQLQIRAPGLTFLQGPPLARLKDGRSVRMELALMVLPAPGRTALVTARRIFGLSYDLWEERFAVTTVDSPPRTISHLTFAAAEAWCIEQLTVPLAALGSLRNDAQFWVRLEYRVLDGEDAGTDDGSAFTLQGLIDALSRRRRTESETRAIEGGPFRLPGRGGASSSRR